MKIEKHFQFLIFLSVLLVASFRSVSIISSENFHVYYENIGASIKFECKTNRTNSPELIRWYKNGVMLATQTQTYYIDNVRPDDLGFYMCNIHNEKDDISNATVSFSLSVKTTREINQQQLKPKIKLFRYPIVAINGMPMQMTCMVSNSNINSTFEWYHRGVYLKEGASIMVSITPQSSGEYICRLKDSNFSAKASHIVYVYSEGKLNISSNGEYRSVFVGSDVQINCGDQMSLKNKSTKVKWAFDTNMITTFMKSKMGVRMNAGILTFLDANAYHKGKYECHINGQSQGFIQLNIIGISSQTKKSYEPDKNILEEDVLKETNHILKSIVHSLNQLARMYAKVNQLNKDQI